MGGLDGLMPRGHQHDRPFDKVGGAQDDAQDDGDHEDLFPPPAPQAVSCSLSRCWMLHLRWRWPSETPSNSSQGEKEC